MMKAVRKLIPARLRRVVNAPRRLARRRGFGIHSPFAFDFVNRVIAQPCSYYAYDSLNALAASRRVSARRMRLVFRTALHFRPSTAEVLADKAFSTALELACPAQAPTAGVAAEMIVASAERVDADAMERCKRCLSEGGTVVLLDCRRRPEPAEQLWESTSRGMLFASTDATIFVGLKHLPRQRFNLWM